MSDNRESKEKVTVEKAIEILSSFTNNYFGDKLRGGQVGVVDIIELLKEQETKTGHWIDSAGADKCSVCGAIYSDLYPDYQHTHYCPNCGSKMTGGEEDA